MNENLARAFESTEDLNAALAKLMKGEIVQVAGTVTKVGEWDAEDADIVLRSLAQNGLRAGESLYDGILRGVGARVGVHEARGDYAADKEGRVIRLKDKGDLPEQAQQSRAA